MIITNPPYGERLSNAGLEDLYARVGSTLKHNYAGFSAWILTSNFEALKKIALKPIIKHKIYNGNLESAYNRYDLYEGSRKERVKQKLTI
jgi:putative N6-adenine-specific DNA methylase